MLVFCKQDSSEETWAPPITVLINWKEGVSQKPITKSLQGPLQGAWGGSTLCPPPTLGHLPTVLFQRTPGLGPFEVPVRLMSQDQKAK